MKINGNNVLISDAQCPPMPTERRGLIIYMRYPPPSPTHHNAHFERRCRYVPIEGRTMARGMSSHSETMRLSASALV